MATSLGLVSWLTSGGFCYGGAGNYLPMIVFAAKIVNGLVLNNVGQQTLQSLQQIRRSGYQSGIGFTLFAKRRKRSRFCVFFNLINCISESDNSPRSWRVVAHHITPTSNATRTHTATMMARTIAADARSLNGILSSGWGSCHGYSVGGGPPAFRRCTGQHRP